MGWKPRTRTATSGGTISPAPCGIGASPLGDITAAGEHCQHARRCERCRFVDRYDVRKGMGRAHDHGMRQLRQTDIVGEAASAGQEAEILFAPHWLTDAVHVARPGFIAFLRRKP